MQLFNILQNIKQRKKKAEIVSEELALWFSSLPSRRFRLSAPLGLVLLIWGRFDWNVRQADELCCCSYRYAWLYLNRSWKGYYSSISRPVGYVTCSPPWKTEFSRSSPSLSLSGLSHFTLYFCLHPSVHLSNISSPLFLGLLLRMAPLSCLDRAVWTCYITCDWYFLTRAIITSHAVLPKTPFAVLHEKYLQRSPCWKITSLLWELFSHHLQLKPILASSKQFLFFPSSNSFLPERLESYPLVSEQAKISLVLMCCKWDAPSPPLDTMSHWMDSGAGYTNLLTQWTQQLFASLVACCCLIILLLPGSNFKLFIYKLQTAAACTSSCLAREDCLLKRKMINHSFRGGGFLQKCLCEAGMHSSDLLDWYWHPQADVL